ncbi:MAG: hypothetical protein J6J35_07415 [Alphaproteobacteria bacterium]|nr:hypothetical protein [Alphaproteobacteria bacterium]
MTKQELWQQTKKVSFWLTYIALMGFNLLMLGALSIDLYYEIFNPVYWRDNFTMYPDVKVEIPTPLSNKLQCLKGIFVIILALIWGNYRLYKKKKGVLWILAFWVWLAIIEIFYFEVIKHGDWGTDF